MKGFGAPFVPGYRPSRPPGGSMTLEQLAEHGKSGARNVRRRQGASITNRNKPVSLASFSILAGDE